MLKPLRNLFIFQISEKKFILNHFVLESFDQDINPLHGQLLFFFINMER